MDLFSILFATLVLSFVINIAMFFVAYQFRTDKLTDISYALTFIALVGYGLLNTPNSPGVNWVVFAMVTLWALRLGTFLLIRIWKTGVDHRFDGLREDFWKFGKFWLGQALSVWVILLPSLMTFSQPVFPVTVLTFIGIGIWFVGLIIESTADLQKYTFTQNPANKNKWINTGVWCYSRHPNYFGEILVWAGVYLAVLSALPPALAFVGLVSPLFITCLLLFISGIPPLEKSADKRWGSDAKYHTYKRRTSILIPWPPKTLEN